LVEILQDDDGDGGQHDSKANSLAGVPSLLEGLGSGPTPTAAPAATEHEPHTWHQHGKQQTSRQDCHHTGVMGKQCAPLRVQGCQLDSAIVPHHHETCNTHIWRLLKWRFA